jgi:aminoglycoside phosphotransferase (APT) family kinase protein
MDHNDRPAAVRDGEQFDLHGVEAFLKDRIPGLTGPATVRQFPGGASNLTYLLCFGDRKLVLRRPPFGTKAATAHDMGREVKVLTALSDHFPYAPRPVAYTTDEGIIGCPFYVMEPIEGIILRKDMPAGLFASASQVRGLFERFVEVMQELHALDYQKIGLADLGKPEGYVKRQVMGWSKRYRAARTPDVPDFEEAMAWLEAKMPPESERPAIIHNDFKLDNVVLDPANPTRIIGILDWEMSTIGDPLMDLGSTLGYWVQSDDPPERHLMRMMPTHLEGALTRRQFVTLYGRLSGTTMARFDFYHCFGLFRLAGIIQQIYYRFHHGQTKDERFRGFAAGVQILERAARGVMAASDL